MDEEGEINAQAAAQMAEAAEGQARQSDAAVTERMKPKEDGDEEEGEGEEEDEFVADAMNYQNLLGKIDMMLDRLKLDA